MVIIKDDRIYDAQSTKQINLSRPKENEVSNSEMNMLNNKKFSVYSYSDNKDIINCRILIIDDERLIRNTFFMV